MKSRNIYNINNMFFNQKLGVFIAALLMIVSAQNAFSTHIVGGDLQYRCLGNDQYELRLTVLRDCFNGDPEAIFDNPAEIWIYDGDYNEIYDIGNPAPGKFSMKFMGADTLYDISQDPCFNQSGGVLCTEITEYRDTVYLPYREGGYRLAYQRCCRNTLIQNIIDPLETGSTYETYITDAALETCNSGPFVTDFPDLYVCLDQQFSIDQTSFDAEGDSIVYKLCDPNQGATKENPVVYNFPDAPFEKIQWRNPPYSLEDQMGNPDDPVMISQNGILTGTPNKTGTYLLGFCIEEYRNGQLLSRSNRDFEITVLPCGNIPDAQIDAPAAFCEGLTFTFGNNSTNAESYEWFFDFENDKSFTSNEEEPTVTYEEAGCYTVALVATLDSVCYDTAYQEFCISPESLFPDFEAISSSCEGPAILELTDLSEDTLSNIIERNWLITLGDSTYTLSGENPSISLNDQGTATIELTVTNALNCTATITKEIDINFITLDFISDSITICKGETTALLENGNMDFDYSWEPDSSLDLTNDSDPIAKPEENTNYMVTVTDGLCTVSGNVFVKVNGSDFDIIDLSDSCNIQKLLTSTYSDSSNIIEWSYDDSFNSIIATGDTVFIEVRTERTVYARIFSDRFDCFFVDEIDITHDGLNLDYPDRFIACQGDEEIITINDQNGLEFQIEWDSSRLIGSALDTNSILIKTEILDSAYLHFTATADNGCVTSDSIFVKVVSKPNADFSIDRVCGSLSVQFTNLSSTDDVQWDFGDGESSTEVNPEHTYPNEGVYTVTLTASSGQCATVVSKEIEIEEFDVNIPDTVYSCDGEPVSLNPGGNDDYNYNWEPSDSLDDQNSPNPTATVSVPTDFYVTITLDNDSCEFLDTVHVAIADNPEVDFSFDNRCGDLTVDFMNLSSTDDITWNFGDGNTSTEENPTYTYDEDGTYTVTLVANNEFCTDSISKEIKITNIDVELQDTILACDTFSVELNPGGSNEYDYNWQPADSLDDPNSPNPIATVSESTDFYVTITLPGDTCERLDTVHVKVVEVNLEVSDDIRVCDTDPVDIMGSSDNGVIIWTDDQGEVVGQGNVITITPGESDFYTATVEFDGCVATETVTVEIIDLNDIIDAVVDPMEIDLNDTVQLDVLGVDSTFNYSWSPEGDLSDPNIQNPLARPTPENGETSVTYCVTVTDGTGCIGEDCVTVQIRNAPCERPYVFLPNAFSPNNDGDNDVLFLRGKQVEEMTLMIFNRWGQKVFQTDDQSIGWDGTWDGEPQNDDVYGYYLRVQCIGSDDPYIEKGNITLIR